MRNRDRGVLLRRHVWLGEVALEPVERVLKGTLRVLLVIIGIDLKVDDVVAHILKELFTTRFNGTARVRRSNVGWDLSDNVVEGALDIEDLVLASVRIDLGQILMRPCVGRNLMSLCIHPLNYVNEFLSLVNLSLGVVVAGDEEGGLSIVLLEKIEDMCSGVLHRSVIIGDSHVAWVFTGPKSTIDTGTSIGYRTNLCSRDGLGALALRLLVFRAARTVFVLAIWSGTIT